MSYMDLPQLLVGQEDLQQLVALGKNFGKSLSGVIEKGIVLKLHTYVCIPYSGKGSLNVRTFSKQVGERTGQPTILNTLTIARECSAYIPKA